MGKYTGMQSVVNNPPSKPDMVYPANEQQNLPETVTFQWKAVTDPDGDPVTYDFYNCTDSDPANNCAAEEVASLGSYVYYAGLNPGATYHWAVVAKDNYGGETQSDVWSFTTR